MARDLSSAIPIHQELSIIRNVIGIFIIRHIKEVVQVILLSGPVHVRPWYRLTLPLPAGGPPS